MRRLKFVTRLIELWELARATAYVFRRSRRSRITQANGAAISPGMTEQQVRAILGPPRERRARATEPAAMSALVGRTIAEADGLWFDDWIDNETWIRVVFDEKGKVACRLSSQLCGVDHSRPSDRA